MIYKSRYMARKNANKTQVVAKVDAGYGEVGYKIMEVMEYLVWKKQK